MLKIKVLKNSWDYCPIALGSLWDFIPDFYVYKIHTFYGNICNYFIYLFKNNI